LYFFGFFSLLSAQESLRLTAFLEAPSKWYPGQVGVFVYEIEYEGEIRLTDEFLPLFKLEGFEKLGDIVRVQSRLAAGAGEQLRQKVRAKEPGRFNVPGAYLVAGDLKATTPPFYIDVFDFPAEGRPPSFTGSVGQFNFFETPLSVSSIQQGEVVDTLIRVEFVADSYLLPPQIATQPGFAGFFQVGETLKVASGEASEAVLNVKFSPNTELLSSIPAWQWSYFNPNEGGYVSWDSTPTQLQVVKESVEVDTLPSFVKTEDVFMPPVTQVDVFWGEAPSDVRDILNKGKEASSWAEREFFWNEALGMLIDGSSPSLDSIKATLYRELGSWEWADAWQTLANNGDGSPIVVALPTRLHTVPVEESVTLTLQCDHPLLKPGTVVNAKERKGSWMRVSFGPHTGFLPARDLTTRPYGSSTTD
jgi:hypothetical protein